MTPEIQLKLNFFSDICCTPHI